jgi:hypothetical protein
MKEKEIKIGEYKFKIKELSWGDQLDLAELEKFTTRDFMKKCVIEPDNLDELYKKLSKAEGTKLLSEINEINRLEEDFQDSNQTLKEPTQNTG